MDKNLLFKIIGLAALTVASLVMEKSIGDDMDEEKMRAIAREEMDKKE